MITLLRGSVGLISFAWIVTSYIVTSWIEYSCYKCILQVVESTADEIPCKISILVPLQCIPNCQFSTVLSHISHESCPIAILHNVHNRIICLFIFKQFLTEMNAFENFRCKLGLNWLLSGVNQPRIDQFSFFIWFWVLCWWWPQLLDR